MRITGGIHRSRALKAPRGQATRPTSDRVREALFGILESAGVVRGARVLDLYAGTGALALESLSRGAEHAVLVESSRDALAALRANVAALTAAADASRVAVLAEDIDRAGKRVAQRGPFDLVFADPPYALVDRGNVHRALAVLIKEGALTPDAWVVLEHAARTEPPDVDGLVRFDARRYGDTALAFYKPAILGPLRASREE